MPRKPPAAVTVKQATLDLLRAFGIKKVFGNPGSTELPFLSDWPDDIDDAGCAKMLVGELNGMADALEHWPALWQHAAEQGEKLLSAL